MLLDPKQIAPHEKHPPIRAVSMSLFPTFSSLEEAYAYAEAKIPITNRNELHALLMTYQNTLLHALQHP